MGGSGEVGGTSSNGGEVFGVHGSCSGKEPTPLPLWWVLYSKPKCGIIVVG